MNIFLVIIVLALIAIALWQLTKIFDLTQVGVTKDESGVANDKDNNLQGYIAFGFLCFIYLFSIFNCWQWGHFMLHDAASEHGHIIDNLFNITLALIFFVQTITQGLLYYFTFKYRGNTANTALYFSDSSRLEIIWSVIPAVVLAGLIGYGLFAWNDIMFVDEKTEDVMVVEIYAQQFNWTARYSGKDNVLGKANVRYIEGINTLGVDMEDKYAQDDISVKELHLPKGKKIVFKIRSQDVLHSAYFPYFRAQMNCVPGMVTQFAFKPIYTTEEYRAKDFMIEKVNHINNLRAEKSKELIAEGGTALDPYTFDYLLLCNKICGASHYNMQMKIVVDTPADFKKWLATQPTIVKQIADEKAANAPKLVEAGTPKVDSIKVSTPAEVAVIAKK
jgi:cytochrome c oxidase subunit II